MRTVGPRVRDRLAEARAQGVVGRDVELARAQREMCDTGAIVTFVHGIGGIGKTSFLDALAPRLTAAGADVARLDGRCIEPTPNGFLTALAETTGTPHVADIEGLAANLNARERRVVVLLDEYDRVRLLDAWLRRSLLPAMPARTRWIFAGRFAPRSAWIASPGWSDAVLSLHLGELDEPSARALLSRRGLSDGEMREVLAFARGIPLALELAAHRASVEGLGALDSGAVLDALAARSIDGLDPDLRDAAVAMSLVRRATRTVLEAMLGRPCSDLFLATIAELPFVDRSDEGLMLHETVRRAVAARLAALDPDRSTALRRAAWRALEAALENAEPTGPHAWRLTADLLFAIEHPAVREAFFPEHETELSVDAALPEDRDAVLAIVKRHEPRNEVTIFEHWWNDARPFFDVVRSASGTLVGFSIVGSSTAVPPSLRHVDPLLSAWYADLEGGTGRDRGALFVRAILTAEGGESPTDARGALWLAAKRRYVERPAQWALYFATRHAPDNALLSARVGFRDASIDVNGTGTLRLEFGARGIWSWLRQLMHQSSDSPVAPTATTGWQLDEPSRGLVVDGRGVALSPLEFATLGMLQRARGAVVTRDELLEGAWKQRHTGSNVVDALVRLLRKKLGPYAASLETVKGHGYRLVAKT